ncbi:hypothetical protein JMJ77_0014376 [Colletotrichum scovillei]|uniref:Uncharacterized protein n=1 Tax=Colletotrichum scovillei TaxID=1209932 RepID=A0A9P7UBM6_9PEZI|nr:hypothetical protein JMJ77_0014376 [Colletotrichum scovillei]KAG7065906.1 hypothetical protein JMJ78_0012649 [Colletotrichum scovillei]KAG7068508.1 hypothetical protein JMJ76_0008194 [Colletotrichum scovillei]
MGGCRYKGTAASTVRQELRSKGNVKVQGPKGSRRSMIVETSFDCVVTRLGTERRQ